MSDYKPWKPPVKEITVEDVYGDNYPRPGERRNDPKFGLCVATDEFRPPREGDLFERSRGVLEPAVYQADSDYGDNHPRIILRKVKTIKVPQIVRVLPGRVARNGKWYAYNPDDACLLKRHSGSDVNLCDSEHLVEVQIVEVEVPE